MKVILKDTVYEMNRKQFQGICGVAKKSMDCGIYAVEKDCVAEMKNEQYKDRKLLVKAVNNYKSNGFVVYWKG